MVDGVTNSVRRIVEHLGARPRRADRRARRRTSEHAGCRSCGCLGRAAGGDLDPGRRSAPPPAHRAAGVPARRRAPRGAAVVGSAGLAAARRIGAPTVAVYQTDVAGFASSYGLGLTARAAWWWTCRLHAQAARTLAPSSWAIAELRGPRRAARARLGRGVDAARFTPRKRCAALRATLAPHGEVLVATSAASPPRSTCTGWPRSPTCPGCGWWWSVPGRARRGCGRCCRTRRSSASATATSLPAATRHWTCSSTPDPPRRLPGGAGSAGLGVPVVAPDTGGPRDLVLPDRTGYLVGDDTALGRRATGCWTRRCAPASAPRPAGRCSTTRGRRSATTDRALRSRAR